MHLRFEDFLSRSVRHAGRIGTFAGADLSDTMDRVAAQHPLFRRAYGRRQPRTAETQTITPTAAAPRLPTGHALCLDLVSRPLARELGYG
jgi:hypothetical protein